MSDTEIEFISNAIVIFLFALSLLWIDGVRAFVKNIWRIRLKVFKGILKCILGLVALAVVWILLAIEYEKYQQLSELKQVLIVVGPIMYFGYFHYVVTAEKRHAEIMHKLESIGWRLYDMDKR